MASFCALVSALFLVAAPIGQIYATPNGAPPAACSTMNPQHGVPSQNPSTSPFVANLPNGFFSLMDSSVKIELRPVAEENPARFKGYLVMAFRSGTEEPIGTFDQISDGQTLDCTNAVKNAVTHKNNQQKRSVSVTWTPPANFMGDVVFRTTFVQDKSTFWVKTETKPVTIGHHTPAETTTAGDPTSTTTTSKPADVTTPKSAASQAQSTWASLIVISLVAFLMRS